MKQQGWAMATALLLTACGVGADTAAEAPRDAAPVAPAEIPGDVAGAVGAAAAGVSTANRWPEEAPAFAPAYPGGAVESRMSGTSKDRAGAMVSFTTSDPPDAVLAFYREKANVAGLSEQSDLDMGGARMLTATDKRSGDTLSVTTTVEDGRTRGILTFSRG